MDAISRFEALLWLVCCLAGPALGVECSGTCAETSVEELVAGAPNILGTVRDSAGAAVAGAEVVLEPLFDGERLKFVADLSGKFAVSRAPTGAYSVRISYDGFTPYELERVEVTSSAAVKIDARLEVPPLGCLMPYRPRSGVVTAAGKFLRWVGSAF